MKKTNDHVRRQLSLDVSTVQVLTTTSLAGIAGASVAVFCQKTYATAVACCPTTITH
jgi:hypothetical protein